MARIFVPIFGSSGDCVPSAVGGSFPTTPILDSFTRANENPLSFAGSWTHLVPFDDTDDLKLVSNAVLKDVTTANKWAARYWNPSTFGPRIEAYVTLSTRPTNDGEEVGLYARADAGDLTNFPSYELIYKRVVAGTDTLEFRLYPTGGGASSQVGSTITQNVNSGDSFGLSILGDTLTAYFKASGGSWTSIGTATDTSHPGAGTLALEMGGAGSTGTAQVTNFGGGTSAL